MYHLQKNGFINLISHQIMDDVLWLSFDNNYNRKYQSNHNYE